MLTLMVPVGAAHSSMDSGAALVCALLTYETMGTLCTFLMDVASSADDGNHICTASCLHHASLRPDLDAVAAVEQTSMDLIAWRYEGSLYREGSEHSRLA